VLPAAGGYPYGQNVSAAPTQLLNVFQSGTGPAVSSVCFTLTDAVQLTNGQLYDLTKVLIGLVITSSTAANRPCNAILSYAGQPLATGALGTGSDNTAGDGPGFLNIDYPVTRPRITGLTGGHFSVQVCTQDGSAFAAGQAFVQFTLYVQPALI
jgi:hypothetical protein